MTSIQRFSVKLIDTKDCFIQLPRSSVPASENVNYCIFRAEWVDVKTQDPKTAYLMWSWGSIMGSQPSIGIPYALANSLELEEDQKVSVEKVSDVPIAKEVHLQAKNADDFEILTNNQKEIESGFLNQIRCGSEGMTLPVFCQSNMLIQMQIDKIISYNNNQNNENNQKDHECYKFELDTELVIKSPSETTSQDDRFKTSVTLRIQELDPQQYPASPADDSRIAHVSPRLLRHLHLHPGDILKLTYLAVYRKIANKQPGATDDGGGGGGGQEQNPLEPAFKEIKKRVSAYVRVYADDQVQQLNEIRIGKRVREQLYARVQGKVAVQYVPPTSAALIRTVFFKRIIDESGEMGLDTFSSDTMRQAFLEWIQEQEDILDNNGDPGKGDVDGIPVPHLSVVSLNIKSGVVKRRIPFLIGMNDRPDEQPAKTLPPDLPIDPAMAAQITTATLTDFEPKESSDPFSPSNAASAGPASSSAANNEGRLYLINKESLSQSSLFPLIGGTIIQKPIETGIKEDDEYVDAKIFTQEMETALKFVHSNLDASKLAKRLHLFQQGRANHILITGGHSSGKTMFSKALCKSLNCFTFMLNCVELSGERTDTVVAALRSYVEEAVRHAPAVLVLDDLHAICQQEQEMTPDLNVRIIASVLVDILSGMSAGIASQRHGISIVATAPSMDLLHNIVHESRLFASRRIALPSPSRPDRLRLFRDLLASDWEGSLTLRTDAATYVGLHTENFTLGDVRRFTERVAQAKLLRDGEARGDVTQEDVDRALDGFISTSAEGVSLVKTHTSWDEIGGLVEVKRLLKETLELPSKYARLFDFSPLKLRSGILLYGPPGCGKTLLASAVAHECGLQFISIKGPELLNKYIGASEQSVREVFEKAEAVKPCVVFFDEFDAIAPKRGHDNTGVTDRVVNQLLCQLDGIESRAGVYVLAATSRPDLIDAALLRPGRLDKAVTCGLPTLQDRREILRRLSAKMRVSNDIDWHAIAEQCQHFSGADLQALLYSALVSAAHRYLEEEEEGGRDPSMRRNASKTKKNGEMGAGVQEEDIIETRGYTFVGEEMYDDRKRTDHDEEGWDAKERSAREIASRYLRMTARMNMKDGNGVMNNDNSEYDDDNDVEGKDGESSLGAEVTMADVEEALNTSQASLSAQDLMEYQMIYEQFERSRGGDTGASFLDESEHPALNPPQMKATLA